GRARGPSRSALVRHDLGGCVREQPLHLGRLSEPDQALALFRARGPLGRGPRSRAALPLLRPASGRPGARRRVARGLRPKVRAPARRIRGARRGVVFPARTATGGGGAGRLAFEAGSPCPPTPSVRGGVGSLCLESS